MLDAPKILNFSHSHLSIYYPLFLPPFSLWELHKMVKCMNVNIYISLMRMLSVSLFQILFVYKYMYIYHERIANGISTRWELSWWLFFSKSSWCSLNKSKIAPWRYLLRIMKLTTWSFHFDVRSLRGLGWLAIKIIRCDSAGIQTGISKYIRLLRKLYFQ